MPKEIEEDIGNAKVVFTGNALYLLGSGGDWNQGEIKGSFGAGMGGNHLVVYIEDKDEETKGSYSYQLDVRDMIGVCVEHYKKLKAAKKKEKK